MTHINASVVFLKLSVALLGCAALLACSSSDENAKPSIPSAEGPGGAAGSGDELGGAGGSSGAGAAGDGGSAGTAAGDGGSAGWGGSSGWEEGGEGSIPQDCDKGQPDCFCGKPKQPSDYLNGCTSAQCLPFDNAARAPLFKGGKLPPLP